jgi:hypothetical protein
MPEPTLTTTRDELVGLRTHRRERDRGRVDWQTHDVSLARERTSPPLMRRQNGQTGHKFLEKLSGPLQLLGFLQP